MGLSVTRGDNLPLSSQAVRPLGTILKPDGKDWAWPRDHGLSGGVFTRRVLVGLPWDEVSGFSVLEIRRSWYLATRGTDRGKAVGCLWRSIVPFSLRVRRITRYLAAQPPLPCGVATGLNSRQWNVEEEMCATSWPSTHVSHSSPRDRDGDDQEKEVRLSTACHKPLLSHWYGTPTWDCYLKGKKSFIFKPHCWVSFCSSWTFYCS